MKRIMMQIVVIAIAAIAAGLIRNQLSPQPLPLLHLSQSQVAAGPTTEDLEQFAARFPEVDAEMVQQLAETPGVIVIDARSTGEYAAGHIPGAINLPVASFAESLPTLRERLHKASEVILYCSSRDCHDSLLLGKHLHEAGIIHLMLFRGGWTEWRQRGYDGQR